MKRMVRGLVLGVMALGLASCYPNRFDDADNSTLDTVITLKAPNADFTPLRTYAITDMIRHIEPPDNEIGDDDITRVYDQQILNRIRSNMNALGWTEKLNPSMDNLPDVAIGVYITTTDYIGIISGGGCWWGWYGYCWDWYYPSYVYSYTVGSLGFSIIDVKNPNMPMQRLNVLWTGILNGPLDTTNAAGTQQRLNDGIDQAFHQSPYLEVQ